MASGGPILVGEEGEQRRIGERGDLPDGAPGARRLHEQAQPLDVGIGTERRPFAERTGVTTA